MSVIENIRDYFVIRHKLSERFRIGGISGFRLFGRRKSHFFKEHLAKLLGRIHVKLLAREAIYTRHQRIGKSSELLAVSLYTL